MIRNIILATLITALWSCAESNDSEAAFSDSNTGTGGSLARFTIVGDYLYTVDQTTLHTFDISKAQEIKPLESTLVGEGVETIFPLNGFLFLGTRSGMLIYRISQGGAPQFVSNYQHVVSCDPVVANSQYAYVTLRVSNCRQAGPGAANQLEIIDIRNLNNPQVVAMYEMESPFGLGLDGQTLFLCEGSGGLKVYDVANPQNIQLLHHLTSFNAIDVIPLGGLLLVIGPDRIVQLDYSDINNIKVVSEIAIGV
ncbi:MAG: hypothetical protein KDD19_04790 [Phaeodactylibacter sp.]|nr:hypothetical protein [Phaeodactylibacter sp.]MCB9048494.1 hypothetical protein [Lewinellaceae bacterium]